MKLLTSKKLTLPKVYFITDRKEIKDLPIGVPFIFGDESAEEGLIRVLEYEVLYQEALKSGFPFNFRKILNDNGYTDLINFGYDHPLYMDIVSDEMLKEDTDIESLEFSEDLREDSSKLEEFIRDSTAYVDIEKLKKLNVFPTWLNDIEKAVHTNIHNFAVYNENMYNKKLEGMFGALDLTSPPKNLIVIDISSSIPRAVSSTCLTLAKNLAETFYADLLITGSKSTLYEYERLTELNIRTIYNENGMDNDQVYFKKLVTSDVRKYKTAIVFGDNHSPSMCWSNSFNKSATYISREDGKKLCKWEISKLISFHTIDDHGMSYQGLTERPIAGYADWFEPEEIQHVEDWVKYLN